MTSLSRSRARLTRLAGIVGIVAMAGAGPIPPGRQYRLTIEGENTLTFQPGSGLPPVRIDYRARVEYIVDTRLGKGPGAPAGDVADQPPAPVGARPPARSRPREGGGSPPRVAGSLDLSLHSTEVLYRQDGRAVLESRMSRNRFQGRIQPDAPVLSVTAKEAPPRLQEILKAFDTTAAVIRVDGADRVVDRKFRSEGPQRALIETIASIHAPMPREGDSWEAPSRLAMGQGQTAGGTLRFEQRTRPDARPGEAVHVKVSGALKGEGVVAGNLIKEGRYAVTGEQTFDPKSREWTSARWSVTVDNELANPAGLTVARARGTMIVETRAADVSPTPAAVEPKP